jgi:hypothetical protein
MAQEIEGAGWDYRVPVGEPKRLAEYWQDKYDWQAWEARLNEFPQFTTPEPATRTWPPEPATSSRGRRSRR